MNNCSQLKILINRNDIRVIVLSMFLFSTMCFRNDNNLNQLLIFGIIVIICSFLLLLSQGLSLKTILSNKAFLWIFSFFSLYELYGFFYIRMGYFNWDLKFFTLVSLASIIFLLSGTDDTEKVFYILTKACIISLIAASVYMYIKGDLTLSFNSINFGNRIGDSLTGNVNTTAVNFGLLSFVVFYSLIKDKKNRFVKIIVCFISAIVMLFTGSKKAIIVMIFSLLLWQKISKKSYKYLIVPLALGVGVYMIFTIPALYNTIGYRLLDAFATFGFGEAVSSYQSTQIRSSFITLGFKSFLKVPIFGGGVNYFQYINNVYSYSHNNYIELLNTFGILGFALYYVPVIKLLKLNIINSNYEKTTSNEGLSTFFVYFIILQLVLDIGMVSFAGSGLGFLAYIIPMICSQKGNALNSLTTNSISAKKMKH